MVSAPLREVMRDRSVSATARAACERLGYELGERTGEDSRRGVPLARPGEGATALAGAPTTLEVHALEDADPHRALSLVARAAAEDRVALLVGESAVARDLSAALANPPLVRAETATGERTFHTGSDRVHLAEGGLALQVTRGRPPQPRPTFRWHEESAASSGATDRSGSDRRRLVLRADGEVVTRVDGVEALTCPGPSRERFTHHYRREDDRLLHVYDADGEPTGVFSTVAALRRRGFHPVPAPVVPEHLFHDARRPPRRSWAVVDEEGRVTTDAGTVE